MSEPPDFGLIETLLWTPAGGYHLLPEHLARLAASSASLGFAHDEKRIVTALDAAIAGKAASHLRVRLVLSRDGGIETGVTPIEPVPSGTVWRVAVAQKRFSSVDPLLRHKTTRRALYEDELAAANAREGADEVVFLNERDEICESARCNLFLPQGDTILTPPLASGLLPGTLRARLLHDGRAREATLRLADISNGFLLGNSVRGLVHSNLLGAAKP